MFEVGYSELEDLAIKVFPMILEESYWWRSIDLNLTLPLLEKLKAAHGRIPCLESLTMEIYNPPSIEELPRDVSSVFMDAPHLQRVVLHHGCGPNDFLIPLYITHLAMIMDSHPKIEAYQSLVECHLALQNSRHFASPPHPIHLPNVRCLFVSSSDLLLWLCLSLLDDLTILNGPNLTYDMSIIILMMNEFVHHSHCTLTHLAIHNYISHNPIFINDCLLFMDSLVTLKIGLGNFQVKAVLDALSTIKFLPNFQHLSLQIAQAQWSPFNRFTAVQFLEPISSFDQNILWQF
ncbi:hypothetical protein F5146DRAFT_1136764 [Armillaria mellea]|nr:hypothetical protein F5146DRAFT_1136764 [Armillaria mellea]